MLKIAFSPIYKYELPEGHRFPMEKYELLPEQLIYEGTVSEDQFFHPPSISDQEILRTHSAEFLHKLNNNTLSKLEALCALKNNRFTTSLKLNVSTIINARSWRLLLQEKTYATL